jgi:hypothetical protein
MPNRNARPVEDLAPFKGQGALAEGLLPVPRNEGQFARQDASVFNGLAEQLNTIADTQAKVEGQNAGKVAGLNPNYRPEGATTIRGRSFEDAAGQTYVNELQAKVRDGVWKIYQENISSPENVAAAIDTFKQGLLDKDVFPDIRGQFDKDFGEISAGVKRAAFGDLTSRLLEREKASNMQANAAGMTAAARAVALNPQDPQAISVARREISAARAREEAAVRSGAMTAVEAERNHQNRVRDVHVGLIVSKLDKVEGSAAKLAELDDFKKRWAAGDLKDLDADGYEVALSQMQKRVEMVGRQERAALDQLSTKATSIAERTAMGLTVPSLEVDQVKDAARKIPGGDAEIRRMQSQQLIATVARNRSPDQIEEMAKTLQERTARDGGATEDTAANIAFLRKVADQKRTAITNDPITYGARQGLVPFQPIDFAQPPAAVAAAVQARIATAQVMAPDRPGGIKYFTPDELANVKLLAERGGKEAAAVAQAIVEGAGPRHAGAMLREIGDGSHVFAQVGALMSSGIPTIQETARLAAEGAAMKRDSGLPGPDRPGEVQREVLGDALRNSANNEERVRRTADAIYARLKPPALDDKTPEARKVYEQALQLAAGRHVVDGTAYGGFVDFTPGSNFIQSYRTYVPPDVKATRFRDVIGAIDDDVINEVLGGPHVGPTGTMSARDFRRATPAAIGDGKYKLVTGDPGQNPPATIKNHNGSDFILDMAKWGPALRRKVPDAFLGGSPSANPSSSNSGELPAYLGVIGQKKAPDAVTR